MVVLQHDHPLTLIDLNPRYPRDEEAYDDEEDLIIKQAFKCPCALCKHEITYAHRYYYKCDQCDYSLHKLCAELPRTLDNSCHSAHTLTLFLDESKQECHMCKSVPWYSLCYHCSLCMFNICLDCGTIGAQYHTLYHPGHQHPIIPLFREISTSCVCGKEHNGKFYQCVTCLHFFVHEHCVFRPKRLLIQDVAPDNCFHTHPLILTYSFPKEHQTARFNPTCRVCDNSFTNEKWWVYKCEKCRYYVHLGCLVDMDVTRMRTEYIPLNVRRVPLNDQTYNMITDFLFRETHEMSITHDSHQHPLTLVETRCNITAPMINKVGDLCNGCLTPVMAMPFYECTYGCNFVLHEWCTRLPTKLRGCRRHPQHTLLLLQKAAAGFVKFTCRFCYRDCNGFAYSCVRCKDKFDVCCALTRGRIIHKSHPNHRLTRSLNRWDKKYCRVCLSDFKYETETSLSCKSCSFHLHPGCAFLLPETIRHKYDKHPMTLSYGPVENHEGDYFCEVCEEELNPNGCFYHCHKCVQSIHLACAPLMPQTKPYIFSNSCSNVGNNPGYENVKFGSNHMVTDHPHRLSLFTFTENAGDCTKCGMILGDAFFKCSQWSGS